MKIFHITLFILLFASWCNCQCSKNTELESTITVFDWTTDYFDIWFKVENSPPNLVEIASPFIIAGNSAQFNTDFLAENLDYSIEDGWEIIYYDFGTEQFGVAEPSFALYNRYTGLFRFFMYISANNDSFSEAQIRTYMAEVAGSNKESALFETQNAIHNAIDNFAKKGELNTINKYNESYGTWILSEWTTHYDPCTCVSELKLVFEPVLRNISTVNLNIDGSSNIVPVYSSTNAGNSSIRGTFGIVGDQVNVVGSSLKKGYEVYKAFDNLEKTIEKQISFEDTESTPAILVDLAKIVTGVNSGNYLASAAGIISVINTLSGSSSSKTISSYSANHSFIANGEIEFEAPYGAAEVYVPGSNHAELPQLKVPIYDNVLGIASILETPTYDRLTLIETEIDDCPGGSFADFNIKKEYFKLTEDIVYAINSNAGINSIPKNAKVSIHFEATDLTPCYGDSEEYMARIYFTEYNTNNSLIRVDDLIYRTPYMNLSCLKDYPVSFLTGIYNGCTASSGCGKMKVTPYIKFAMELETEDSKSIAYLRSYKMRPIVPEYNWNNKPINSFLNIPENLEISYEDINEDTQSWGNTTVIDPPNNEIIVENVDGSVQIIQLDTDSDPSTPIKYTTRDFEIDCGEVLAVNDVYLSNFCNNIYDPVVALSTNGLSKEDSTSEEEINSTSLTIFPNPSSDLIKIENPELMGNQYSIKSLTGQFIKQGVLTENGISIVDLPKGIYILNVYFQFTPSTIHYGKFIKI